METTKNSQPEADLFARSAFALLFVGALITLFVGIAVLRAPVRPNVRTPMLIAYGVFFVVVLASMGFVLASPVARLQRLTGTLRRVFGRPGLALVLTVLILIVLAVVVPLIDGIVPSLASLTVLAAVWSVLLIAVLAICNDGVVVAAFRRTRNVWMATGLIVALGLIVVAIFFGVSVLLNSVKVVDRLRGSSDYRDLIFYGNESNPERSQAYWTELGELQNTWVSYVYTRMQVFQGQYINIDSIGRRVTASFVKDTDVVPTVDFFGGSTMWGEGSRDDYTLPSQIARMLDSDGKPIRATNYAQVAYVSTQDMITFQRQLALGNIPDVAVFYGGFNDIAAVYIDGNIAGLPHNEINRERDLLTGQILRDAGRPVLSQPEADFAHLDFSLIGIPNATPVQVADLYLANVRQIRAVAQAYGVKTLFVWQPAILYKQTLTPQEQLFVDENRATWPDFDNLYEGVDQEVRRVIQSDGLTDMLVLSDLFAHESRYLFFDRVHVIEDGNTLIAEAIKPALMAILDTLPSK